MGEQVNMFNEQGTMDYIVIPVGVSNRHVHMSPVDLEMLFGSSYSLNLYKELSQPGEFAAREVVTIVGPRGVIEGVRVLGPIREHTQVEVSMTDAYRLGIRPPVRDSGDLNGTPGIAVVGPKGVIALSEGVILAHRHVHLHTDDAAKMGLEEGQSLRVQVEGARAQILENVLARVSPHYKLEMHIDTDEANAALLQSGDQVRLLH
ncbi:MAG: phosphate propanoyltransferase [Bacillota bacterium]